MHDPIQLLLSSSAALAAGLVNAFAGGGTLITFPALLALGLPAITANASNSLALLPGYIGGVLGQRRELAGRRQEIALVVCIGLVGGFAGALLLVATGERLFSHAAPWLILLATGLLALSGRRSRRGTGKSKVAREVPQMAVLPTPERSGLKPQWSQLILIVAAVYGGYFGAGMSVIALAALSLREDPGTAEDPGRLARLNALKQVFAFSANLSASIFLALSGMMNWPAVAVMAPAALAGGWAGGRLAGRLPAKPLKALILCIGTVVGLAYLVRDLL